MKIANPWPNWPHIRFRCPDGLVGVCGACHEIEVPEGVEEMVIEPVDKGRCKANSVSEPRIWTKEWGLLNPADYDCKVKMKQEKADHDARMEAERVRKAEAESKLAEAEAEAKRKLAEAEAKAKEREKPAKEEKPEK